MNSSVPPGVADMATEDQAFVEQTGISARISAALQKALLLSPRSASPEAFAKVFSDSFICADTQLGAALKPGGDTNTVPPELPGDGEHKDDAGDGDVVSVLVEMMVRIPSLATPPPPARIVEGTDARFLELLLLAGVARS